MHRLRSIIFCLCFLFTGSVHAEPLRLLVPPYIGPDPLSQQVHTTIFLELIKTFRSFHAPYKGAWILYGKEPLPYASHDAVIDASDWPSVLADLAVWGKVVPYDDEVVVQMFLTVNPFIKTRKVRPELWSIHLPSIGTTLELDLPGQFYEFEPLILPKEFISQYQKPEDLPLYSSRNGKTARGTIGEVIRFLEIYDDALRIRRSDGRTGWIQIPRSITDIGSEAISFVHGFVRLLRGDWVGSQMYFKRVLDNSNIPQHLRIHALMYIGLAKEKSGQSGSEQFEAAYHLNRLDKNAASYLVMSRIANIRRARQTNDLDQLTLFTSRLRQEVRKVNVLFPKNDPWLASVKDYLR